MKLKKLFAMLLVIVFTVSMSTNSALAATYVGAGCNTISYTRLGGVNNISSSGGYATLEILALNAALQYVNTVYIKLDMKKSNGSITTMEFTATNGQNLYFGNDYVQYTVYAKLPAGTYKANQVNLKNPSGCNLIY